MARVIFTTNLHRHVHSPAIEVPGETVREVLDAVFSREGQIKSYVLDDQNALRKHMTILVDGLRISDRTHLSDPVTPGSEIYVLQALSGG